jgi:hypothetical protein
MDVLDVLFDILEKGCVVKKKSPQRAENIV